MSSAHGSDERQGQGVHEKGDTIPHNCHLSFDGSEDPGFCQIFCYIFDIDKPCCWMMFFPVETRPEGVQRGWW